MRRLRHPAQAGGSVQSERISANDSTNMTMRIAYAGLALLTAVEIGCAGPAATNGPAYCFVEESPEKLVFELIGHTQPINPRTVLLFPVVENGIINGKPVRYGIGPPVIYSQGTDVTTIQFKGIDRKQISRFKVWARGYFFTGVPRVFLYADTVFGRECLLVELTPLKPELSQQRFESAVIAELKKGQITVIAPVDLNDEADYTKAFRASELKSWVKMPYGYRREKSTWGAVGSKVDFILTDDDFKLIESYFRGEGRGAGTNAPN